ncbi:predicted protein [Naegleria gruberi]|uniref:Predicted protein n=1 Tax=Naegleria gruberi TaxID=5762 RepID=D2V491_NAEGR|nr:uncharacterized protein NAEGRDRAFT_46570 [Naegleria gruberi]EFC48340.1 predicted protein [Naegleria gruberi]|eukprot:XP_002681084.1 predicted protein [Naegleria gruberi strain NEG-M]
MSTLSTKYVPHRLRPENIIKTEAREATLPSNQEHLKVALYASSVCVGEPERTPANFDTTKGDDFDKTGKELMRTALERKEVVDLEKLNSEAYLHDLRGVHFDVGHEPHKPHLKTLAQASFTKPSDAVLNENKKNIITSEQGYIIGKSSIVKHIPEDWKNCLKTNVQDDFVTPSEQMEKNLELGKQSVPRSRPIREQSSVLSTKTIPSEQSIHDIRQENEADADRIIEDMRTCHYCNNKDKELAKDTEFNSNYGEKNMNDLRYTFTVKKNESKVVMGYDPQEEIENKYNTTYKNTIHQTTNSISHSVERSKMEKKKRDDIRDFMRKSSIEFGNEKPPISSTTQLDYRPVKF